MKRRCGSRSSGLVLRCRSAAFPRAVTDASFPSFCSAPFDRIAEINFNIDADDDSVSGYLGILI